MQLDKQREKVLGYLSTKIFGETIYNIAKAKLTIIYKITKHNKIPSDEEINQYIEDNYTELSKLTNEAIEQLVKEILPDENFITKSKRAFHILFDLGILSIFLFPVLYVCARYAINKYKVNDAITECADGVVAVLLVLMLLGFSIYSYFKNR